MELSTTLRCPLDRYVDAYFELKVRDLAEGLGVTEDAVRSVLEFGVKHVRTAPASRSASRSASPPGRGAPSPSQPPETSEAPAPPSSSVCVYSIKGKNPRRCGVKAKHQLDESWFCKTHLKIQEKKKSASSGRKKTTTESIATKIWEKKIFETKINLIEENGHYFDSNSRICFSPNSKEAFGVLASDGATVGPLEDEHFELIASSNLKFRTTAHGTDPASTGSDGEREELELVASSGSDTE